MPGSCNPKPIISASASFFSEAEAEAEAEAQDRCVNDICSISLLEAGGGLGRGKEKTLARNVGFREDKNL
jgi:hypothetical protein